MAAPPGSPRTPRVADHEDSQTRAAPYRLRRQKSEILRAQYIDVRELRICVGTWNVGTICPPRDLDIQEWLDTDEPADIYVLGFQEIIPLEVGYMIGTEDTRPVAVWEHIIHEALNKKCPDKSKFERHSDSPSPARFNPSGYVLEMDNGLLSESSNDSDGELHLLDSHLGSVSVSMSIHETHFCFVCCHLAAGEKNGDELKRNGNVEDIHRRTVFDNPVHIVGVPQRIHDHECDRILSYGKGTRLLSYKRAELTFSDHRPVTAVYMADVEVFVHRKFQRALTFTNTEVDDHLLLGKEALLEPLNHETGNFPAQVPSKLMAMRYQISESA
ncbi:hypothetical protein C2845_PM06G00540 [Panicum miliaceum]|uniref:Inositol polyphosphate-related phosphatase domain-containing protein n=1 Tax=Panicum miliaceum TaxID=4540 RepID=A0A3L6RE46_PANMI|nr:hypothetical protein C2845_PM06G00540 [Panicum miliaceum]